VAHISLDRRRGADSRGIISNHIVSVFVEILFKIRWQGIRIALGIVEKLHVIGGPEIIERDTEETTSSASSSKASSRSDSKGSERLWVSSRCCTSSLDQTSSDETPKEQHRQRLRRKPLQDPISRNPNSSGYCREAVHSR
jgi:hypothetical protein